MYALNKVNFADFSGNVWVTCFNETAEVILGKSSQVLGPMQKNNPDAFDAVIQEAAFRSYVVKFKSELENYNVSAFNQNFNN